MGDMNNSGLGARLRAARESLQLSEKEAATRLRLNVRFIHMMETENFERGLPETFIRGYFRSYGRLLNLNEAEIDNGITNFQQINATPSPINTIPMQPTILKRDTHQLDRYLRWTSYGIMSLLFVSVITWWASHPRYNEIDAIQTAQTEVPLQQPANTLVASAGETVKQLTSPSHPSAIQAPTGENINSALSKSTPQAQTVATNGATNTLAPQKPLLAANTNDTQKIAKPEFGTEDADEDDDNDNSEDLY